MNYWHTGTEKLGRVDAVMGIHLTCHLCGAETKTYPVKWEFTSNSCQEFGYCTKCKKGGRGWMSAWTASTVVLDLNATAFA